MPWLLIFLNNLGFYLKGEISLKLLVAKSILLIELGVFFFFLTWEMFLIYINAHLLVVKEWFL